MIGVCHCGHADTTHHLEVGRGGPRGACLARGCEECTVYRDSEKKDPGCPKPPKDRVIDEAPVTPRMPMYGFPFVGG